MFLVFSMFNTMIHRKYWKWFAKLLYTYALPENWRHIDHTYEIFYSLYCYVCARKRFLSFTFTLLCDFVIESFVHSFSYFRDTFKNTLKSHATKEGTSIWLDRLRLQKITSPLFLSVWLFWNCFAVYGQREYPISVYW